MFYSIFLSVHVFFSGGLLVTFVSLVDINIVFSIGIGNSSLKTLTSLIHLLAPNFRDGNNLENFNRAHQQQKSPIKGTFFGGFEPWGRISKCMNLTQL